MVAVAVQNWQVDPDTSERPRVRPVTGGGRCRRRVFWFRRFIVLALFAAIAVAVLGVSLGWIGGGPLTAADQPGGMRPAAQRVWVVRPGDTLWGIAAATGDHGDLRPLVDRLSDEIEGRPLQPGERLVLPGS